MKLGRYLKPAIFRDPRQTHMSLGEHLEELRSRVIRALIGIAVAAAVCFYFGDHIFSFICRPLAVAMTRLGVSASVVNLTPQEAFLTYFKISVISGIALATPYLFYQIWSFVAVGLYRHERRWVHIYAPASLLLFAGGVLFLFYVVLPATLYFFLHFQQRHIPRPTIDGVVPNKVFRETPALQDLQQPTTPAPAATIAVLAKDPPSPSDGQIWINTSEAAIKTHYNGKTYRLSSAADQSFVQASAISIASYASLTTMLALAFGLCFQVPLVVVFLVSANVVTLQQFRRSRKYVVLSIFVIAAVITPTPDWQTHLLMAGPMLALFELGLLAGRLTQRLQQRRTQQSPTNQSPVD